MRLAKYFSIFFHQYGHISYWAPARDLYALKACWRQSNIQCNGKPDGTPCKIKWRHNFFHLALLGHQNIKTFLLGHLTVSALHQNQHKVQRSLFVLQSFAIRTTIWADPKRDHHKILIPNNRVYLHKHVIATSFKFRIGKYSRIFLWCLT